MLIRIVKMTFSDQGKQDFLEMFDGVKHRIRGFEGCERLELLQDLSNDRVFFTYSYWQSPEHLEAYRHSDLFAETWKLTKTFFVDRPEAWSVKRVHSLD